MSSTLATFTSNVSSENGVVADQAVLRVDRDHPEARRAGGRELHGDRVPDGPVVLPSRVVEDGDRVRVRQVLEPALDGVDLRDDRERPRVQPRHEGGSALDLRLGLADLRYRVDAGTARASSAAEVLKPVSVGEIKMKSALRVRSRTAVVDALAEAPNTATNTTSPRPIIERRGRGRRSARVPHRVLATELAGHPREADGKPDRGRDRPCDQRREHRDPDERERDTEPDELQPVRGRAEQPVQERRDAERQHDDPGHDPEPERAPGPILCLPEGLDRRDPGRSTGRDERGDHRDERPDDERDDDRPGEDDRSRRRDLEPGRVQRPLQQDRDPDAEQHADAPRRPHRSRRPPRGRTSSPAGRWRRALGTAPTRASAAPG